MPLLDVCRDALVALEVPVADWAFNKWVGPALVDVGLACEPMCDLFGCETTDAEERDQHVLNLDFADIAEIDFPGFTVERELDAAEEVLIVLVNNTLAEVTNQLLDMANCHACSPPDIKKKTQLRVCGFLH